jgi:hypothetical protein
MFVDYIEAEDLQTKDQKKITISDPGSRIRDPGRGAMGDACD